MIVSFRLILEMAMEVALTLEVLTMEALLELNVMELLQKKVILTGESVLLNCMERLEVRYIASFTDDCFLLCSCTFY